MKSETSSEYIHGTAPEEQARLSLLNDYEYLGNDPAIGRRLVSVLVEAGAAPLRNTFIFFGSCAGEPHFAQYVENLIGVINGARTTVVEAALLDAAAFDAAIMTLREWRRDRAASLWYAISWAEGRRMD